MKKGVIDLEYSMRYLFFTSLIIFLFTSCGNCVSNKPFPANFVLGVGTSAYQIEGAWNESGKGINIWDDYTHKFPNVVKDNSNGDIACDSYHKLDEDIAMLKELGVNLYRFQISWSRLLPNGTVDGGVNLEAVKYYNRLLDELKGAGIEAMVTMFHCDILSVLFDRKILLDESMNRVYVDFARFLFETFGDRVKYWNTFNEPTTICVFQGDIIYEDPGIDSYQCVHNIIKSHAMVFRMYEEEFKPKYDGHVTIAAFCEWNQPVSNNVIDFEATERKFMFEIGWIFHPLVFGDYPEIMKKRIREFTPENMPSRLPEFTEEEKKFIKGSLKFIGLDYYRPFMIKDEPNNDSKRSFNKDLGVQKLVDPSWDATINPDMFIWPESMRKMLNWMYNTYSLPIFITENGYPDDGTLDDSKRVEFLKNYLSEVLDAMYIDGVEVLGYSHWSLMDNFEWIYGYTQKYGLYQVNFTSDSRERKPKKSAEYFKKITNTRCLVETCDRENIF